MPNDLTWSKELRDQAYPDTSTNALAAKSGVWMLYSMLLGYTGAATDWALVGSSDASTAGMDTTTRLGTSWTAAKWTRAAAGSAHSWFVLQSPTLGVYLCVDLSTANDLYPASIYWAKTAFTGGSTTARPTSTDEVGLAGTSSRQFATDATAHRANILVSSRGDFVFAPVKNGAGVTVSGLTLIKSLGTKASDAWPWFMFWGQLTSASTLCASTSWAGRTFTGGGAGTIVPPFLASASNGTIALAAFPSTGDAQDQTYPDVPLLFLDSASGAASFRGRAPDIGWAPTACPNGAVSSDGLRVKVDGLWLPFTVAPTF